MRPHGINKHKTIQRLLRESNSQLPMDILGDYMTPSIGVDKSFLSTDYLETYLINNLLLSRYNQRKQSLRKHVMILANERDWMEFIQTLPFLVCAHSHSEGYLIDVEQECLISYHLQSKSTSISLIGDSEFIDTNYELILSRFEECGVTINWVYDSKGSEISTPLRLDLMPNDCMYPFLGTETCEQYYDRFLKSRANILLLIGPPGVGKTTWIRGLIKYANTSALVTYDENILKSDSIFANFIESTSTSIMVVEDSDTFLTSRADGNNIMSKFLNLGDGLVSNSDKKIIFTTNLPNVNDVDEALLRPGRMFDILKFEMLTRDQAQNVANEFNIELSNDQETYTLAEVFNKKNKHVKQSFGFN